MKKIFIYFVIPSAMTTLLIGGLRPGNPSVNLNGFVEGVVLLTPVVYVLSLCLVLLFSWVIAWISRTFGSFRAKSGGHRPPLHQK
jgi:hypothetical protein